MTKRTICVVCSPGSKADAQPRNEVRSVASANPPCQPAAEPKFSYAPIRFVPGAVALAPSLFADSSVLALAVSRCARVRAARATGAAVCNRACRLRDEVSAQHRSVAVSADSFPGRKTEVRAAPAITGVARSENGRSHGYCRCLGRAKPRGLLLGPGRYAEHRALLESSIGGERTPVPACLGCLRPWKER